MFSSKITKLRNRCALAYYQGFKSFRTFTVNGKTYRYFYQLYNHTWRNERAVEIPFVLDFVKRFKNGDILEVGNVLTHYFNAEHDVIDKLETGPHVMRRDIIDFKSPKRYRLIISISTLEHIGHSENIRGQAEGTVDPRKPLEVIEVLKAHLAPGGTLLFTAPVGFNPAFDNLLKGGMAINEIYCLRRISRDNAWVERPFDEVMGLKYGDPFPCANGILFVLIKNGDLSWRESPMPDKISDASRGVTNRFINREK